MFIQFLLIWEKSAVFKAYANFSESICFMYRHMLQIAVFKLLRGVSGVSCSGMPAGIQLISVEEEAPRLCEGHA